MVATRAELSEPRGGWPCRGWHLCGGSRPR